MVATLRAFTPIFGRNNHHAGGLIGLYFFVDENDRHVTVNGECHRVMYLCFLFQTTRTGSIVGTGFFQGSGQGHTDVTSDKTINSK